MLGNVLTFVAGHRCKTDMSHLAIFELFELTALKSCNLFIRYLTVLRPHKYFYKPLSSKRKVKCEVWAIGIILKNWIKV